ncbi:MAG: formate dehydrogenase, delta subunit [Hydrocarboniphaga sp.]|uniref:formate dehydrogenase subunit delta n=1 Tax=Hydrocarboniphaga sp. TaxID=2033016 RepID=UPI00262D460B|nr:formate dehydrogenase subunit delta [Hydrocarboniphaga sp.]MDB5969210.1 formate dehydrogenase, delta subunit [Hydrocarboniphaga sp.]
MNASPDHLVQMVNDIAGFFDAEPDHDAAIAGIENHLRKFWDPRMRRKLIAHLQGGVAEIAPSARAAIARL